MRRGKREWSLQQARVESRHTERRSEQFDQFFADKMEDPEIRAAYDAAVARQEREVERP